jgi:prepilin-type N-terminal cleavage/methylation domain-containing protein
MSIQYPGRRFFQSRHLVDGFTLIELLVVMAIVALLLSIALPRYQSTLNKSRDVALAENLKIIRLTIDQFYGDNGRYPQSLTELVEKKYLRELPLDPVTESRDSWLATPSRDADKPGIVGVKSGAAGSGSGGRAYEAF